MAYSFRQLVNPIIKPSAAHFLSTLQADSWIVYDIGTGLRALVSYLAINKLKSPSRNSMQPAEAHKYYVSLGTQ